MSEIKVRVGKLSDNNIVTLTRKEWARRLGETQRFCQQIMDENQKSRISGLQTNNAPLPFWYFHSYTPLQHLKNEGKIDVVRGMRAPDWMRDRCDEAATAMMAELEKTIEILQADANPAHWGAFVDIGDGRAQFTICIVAGSGCPKCGAILHPSSMKRHVDSPSCRVRVGNHSSQNKDWVRVYDHTTIGALKDAGIAHETRPVAYATWAPKWVLDAAKKFKKSKGFAGMSMKDYLLKMKGE